MPFELQLPRNLKADGWKLKNLRQRGIRTASRDGFEGTRQVASGPERLPIFDSTWWILGRFSQETSTTA